MAEKLCTLRTKGGGGGGKQTETVLWTNSAPTSTFAGQDVTLSDNINNYDYLKFTYRVTTSVADSLNYIISVSDFKKSLTGSSPHHCILGLSSNDSGAHTRRVYYKTDTSVTFDNSYQVNVVATANTTCIPLSIIGIKNMGGKSDKPQFTLLTNYVSTTLNLTTITLDKDITKYNYIIATSNVMPDGYNSFVASKAAVEAIIDIQTFISRGSVTYGSALSNGTAYSITINYVDSTHISTSRTSATNRNLTFYAI